MLGTDLQHITSRQQFDDLIAANPKVMVACGRMGQMCIPVYAAMLQLESEYTDVVFRDMDFDAPEAAAIRTLPEVSTFMGLPFVVYFKNGQVCRATASIQTKDQIRSVLDEEFGR